MISSGYFYWDIKGVAEGFTDFTFSVPAYRGGERGYRDIAYLRSKGVKVSRYLNNASWAGRRRPIEARTEPWKALIHDELDGYTCWTACLWPNLGFRPGYKGYSKTLKIHELPPEEQVPTMLVYIRKDGNVYHPVSCIRTENIRDGIIDALYYRLAKKTLQDVGDDHGVEKLLKEVRFSKRTYAEYDPPVARCAD